MISVDVNRTPFRTYPIELDMFVVNGSMAQNVK